MLLYQDVFVQSRFHQFVTSITIVEGQFSIQTSIEGSIRGWSCDWLHESFWGACEGGC
jgi:hypothetical protein